ncbi:uncharacterized protein DUF2637 [Streptomyces sp. KhCrAH-43]|uniref:DUF2637 domain-containing protein n=1 Tax=unclassified Streptomyces TaxID=2593676 RepID=UPI0003A90074|nr:MULTISPECIES: DUF2637 domain-containing protein [unclassified Streptomyces]MYS32911.1 DUF2637 domain-containing protein [Streptomyces sp. SID4920]MYX64298.1 DUF2637 domain-containing protein [Streptomyces sp. SID8373]RAJ47871.1 uncharacterized protein DUF2637 [Streptomyces sp. KhCrAH-43]
MMDEKFLLPAGIGFAALCVFGIVALVLRSRRTREQDKLSAEDREKLADERRKTWRRRLAVISLSVSFVIIFCIAGIAAWLSFGAQKAYAFDRNGGSWTAATGFALLLDAGALGLSLLRLFEALTARSSQLTRLYLVGFIVASAVMNLLHTPHAFGETPTLGGRLVAVIPPLVYAIFLESLLKKVEQLVLGKYPKKKRKKSERGYSLLLWVPFIGYPREMWKQWRKDLHDTLQYVRAPGSRTPLPAPAAATGAEPDEKEMAPRAQPRLVPQSVPRPAPVPQAPRDPRPAPMGHMPAVPQVVEPSSPATGPIGPPVPIPGPAPAPASVPSSAPPPVRPAPVQPLGASSSKSKKDQLRDALVAQILAGDLRVLDTNAQVANSAAYRANMDLGQSAGLGLDGGGKQEGLMKEGAVRTAVKQLLPELRRAATKAETERARRAAAATAPEPAPQHHAAESQAPDAEAPRERQEDEGPVIGQQRSADAGEATKEAALA